MTANAGDAVFCEGDVAKNVYNISDGVMMMSRVGLDGRRQVLAFLFTGDFVGASPGETYSYSLDAVTDANVCRFERSNFEKLLERHQDVDRRYRTMTAGMLESSYELAYTLGQRNAVERISAFLLYLRQKEHQANQWHNRQNACAEDGRERIQVPMTRTDIADFLGLTIETVSRAIKKLKDKSLIRTAGAHDIDILDITGLREIAETTAL
ncbi:MAG: helix-turn-helix domain-containing protein [Pseudomonadota bacterium]